MTTDDPKEDSITDKPKEKPMTGDSQKLLNLQLKNSFWLFDYSIFSFWIGSGGKFSSENFGLGRLRFYATFF